MIGFREIALDQLSVDHRIEVDTLTGSARLSVPIRTSPGREQLGPSLALAYSSGGRSSMFGVGWALSGLPSIGLDTTRALPAYSEDGDGYVYAGGQRLVPALREEAGAHVPIAEDRGEFRVQRFRSRTERSFERFERWTHRATGRVHWIAHARNGVISVFGLAADNSTRIADPRDPDRRTFQWLLEAQYHPKGNAILYQYKPEDGAGVDPALSFEARRARGGAGFAQRYPKRILYGNSRPLSLAQPTDPANEWRFEVVFDYGEHAPLPAPSDAPPAPPWPVRGDPFSTHRPGFELRTYRLCRRVLVFHRFPELDGGAPTLIGATELTHRDDPAGAVVASITYRGYRKHGDGSTSDRALPPLELAYSEAAIGAAFEPAAAADNLPVGLDGAAYQWMDLRNEGLPGVLCRHHGSWYFKENLGDGRFGPTQIVDEVPAALSAAFQLQDVDGDGNLDLVSFEGREAGFYEHDRDRQRWEGFRSFHRLPRVDFANARVQWVDLNGDGHADLIVERSDRLLWYPSEGEGGFGPAVELARPDARAGGAPTVTQRPGLGTFFADMTGDGLLDLVRIDNGRVEYWPNLGCGEFGPGVVMEGAPTLDDFGELDARRIRLVDLDGSGTADLLYIGRGEIRCWINQSGNRFGPTQRRANLPYIDRLASAQVFDFLGDGTRCLVWSTPLPSHEGQAIQYLRLTDGLPPGLLRSVSNGIGREARLSYRSSAREYLRDKHGERPWRTLMPHHVMVVDRFEGLDRIGGTRMMTRYEYRDGYFDDGERRFAGFGLVDAFDSDQLVPAAGASPEDVALPSVVRTWYHTGASEGFLERSLDFYALDPQAARPPLPELEDVAGLTTEEQLDAYRAIAGVQWRQEFYGIRPDGGRELHPFRITELAYRVRRLQPADGERGAVFAIEQSEALSHEYEQDPSDPRVAHDVVLGTDAFGSVMARASIAYPRRAGGPEVRPEQQVLEIQLTERVHRNVDEDARFEVGIETEERRHALTGLAPAGAVFERAELAAQVQAALGSPLAFHDPPAAGGPRARLIHLRRFRFWDDARAAIAAPGQVGAVTLLHHVERAVFPEAAVASLYEGRVDDAMLAADGRYRREDGFWWADDTTYHYRDAAAFFRLREQTSPGGPTEVHTFDPHFLLVTAVEDGLGNRVESTPDYQALASVRIRDANDNISEVLYDPLGVPTVTVLRGEQLGADGAPHPVGDDDLATYAPVAGATAADLLADPGGFLQGATRYFFHDLDAFRRGEGPPRTIHLEREQHRHDGEGTAAITGRIRTTVRYLDGFGRVIQTKLRADAGPAIQRAAGAVVVDAEGRPVLADAPERWLTSGHDVFNSKGWLARKYEPLFSTTPAFETDQALREHGVAMRTHYDPIGRVVRQDLPDGTFTTAAYASWETRRADANDNVVGSAYEAARQGLPAGDVERRALDRARAHADTPAIVELDPRGRVFRLRESLGGGVERVQTTIHGVLGLAERVIDPRGLAAFTYVHDMLGRSVVQDSMDAGRRVQLLDAGGRAVHEWDARGVQTRHGYDANGRHAWTRVQGAADPGGAAVDNLVERFVYGDDPEAPQARLRNARGRPVQRFDDAGVLTIDRYHMNGQIADMRRAIRAGYQRTVDWTDPGAVATSGPEHRSRMRFDAFGRVVTHGLPDGTTRELTYARIGHVTEVRLTTADGALDRQVIASNIETNARGQRTRLALGNGVETSYAYDPATFRLQAIHTRRVGGSARDYLDLEYTYDPAGNLTHWIDRAQDPGAPTPLLTGLTVSSACEYTYDALYQLTEATGRVHQALLQHDYTAGLEGENPIKGTRHLSLDNGAAIERYTRTYAYDLAGNLQRIHHQGVSRSWTTEIWTSPTSNRSLPAQDANGIDLADPEARFDANGNTTGLPHLRAMDWSYKNRLSRAVIIDRSGSGQPDDAEYYVYGADGLRIRRVTERLVAGQLEVTDTIYFEGCEIRRITRNGNTRLLRHTSHVTDGATRLATLHQWSVDQTALETDDIGRKRLHYLVGNHLGSVSLELDEVGDVISYEEYFPFGGTSFVAGRSARDVKLKEYRYSGKLRDDTTGFYCYEHRYYAPFIGNWLSPDPMGPIDGLNLYRFVHNNPIRFTDPDGLETDRPLEFAFELPPELRPLLTQQHNPQARSRLDSYIEGRPWEFEGEQYRLEGHVEWHTTRQQWVYIIEGAQAVPPPTVIDFSEEDVEVIGGGGGGGGEPPANPDAAADDADTEGADAQAPNVAPGEGGEDQAPADPADGRGNGESGEGPGAGQQGTGPGGGGQGASPGRGTQGEGEGAGTGAGRGTGPGTGTTPGGTGAGTGGTGAGGAGGAQGASGEGAGEPGGQPGGRAGGRGSQSTGGGESSGTAEDGGADTPPVPPGVPTGPDGLPYSPELELPEVTPEAGTPVTNPSGGRAGTGSADARGEPGSDAGSADRPGGTESGGAGGAPGGERGGAPGGQGEGQEGGQPGGGRGLKGGVGDHELPWFLSWVDTALDVVQVGLDVVGLIPGLGEIADGINGLISLARGDYAGAALSFAAMIPFAGWAATAGKWGRRAVNAADAVSDVAGAVARHGDEAASVVNTASRNADEVAEVTARNADEVGDSGVRAATPGSATVHYRPNPNGTPHWTVETNVPGQGKLETHQVWNDRRGRSTQVYEVDPSDFSRPPQASVRVELPDAGAARKAQQEQIGRGDTGPWVQQGPGANSCATAVCEVVSRGGGPFPSNPAEAANFLRGLFNLPLLK